MKHRWMKPTFGTRRICKVCGQHQQRRTVRGHFKWLPRKPDCPGPSA